MKDAFIEAGFLAEDFAIIGKQILALCGRL